MVGEGHDKSRNAALMVDTPLPPDNGLMTLLITLP